MTEYIVLLRGINVGGHKKVPMAELRKLLLKSGFENVSTYIQSGNIILQSKDKSKRNLEKIIQKSIFDHFGFEVPVIVKTRAELNSIFEACPFSEEKMKQTYFVIFSAIPEPELVQKAADKKIENEEFIIVNDCLYLHTSAGFGKSKFNMNWFEKTLEVRATSRNYKTMLKLIAMSSYNL